MSMDDRALATPAYRVRQPLCDVILSDLRDVDGQAVLVRVARIDPLEVLEALGALVAAPDPNAPPATDEQQLRWVREHGFKLIEKSCEPAFSWNGAPDTVPGSYLTLRDAWALIRAVLALSVPEAPAASSFPTDQGGGAGSAGAVDAGEGVRADAVGNPS